MNPKHYLLISSGAVHFTASNNDCGVRDFDMEKFQLSKHFRFDWPVNVSEVCVCVCVCVNFRTTRTLRFGL